MLSTPPDDPDEDLRVLCCRGRWRSVGEVRAAEAYGVDLLRTNIEIAVWTRLLAYEVGGFSPVGIRLPRLPDGAPLATVLARDGFALLLGLRWADFERRPVAFSVRFCRAWCGLPSHRSAHEALRDLIDLGVIQEAGAAGRARLFLPGRTLHAVGPPGEPPPGGLPPVGGGGDAGDDLVAQLIDAFDAEELVEAPAPPGGSPRPRSALTICGYDSHRGRGLDWRLATGSSPPTCGVCHPPPNRPDFQEGVRFVRVPANDGRRFA